MTQDEIVRQWMISAPRPAGVPIPLQPSTTQNVGLQAAMDELDGATSSTAPPYRRMKVLKAQPMGYKPYKLGGLGDVAAVNALLAQADAKFYGIKTNAAKLLAMYGPLEAGTVARMKAAIAGQGPGVYAEMGAAEFAGLINYTLRGAAYSLSLAHALMNGPNPEAQTTLATVIVTSAFQMLGTLDSLIRGAQATETAIASAIRATGAVASSFGQRLGLAGLGRGELGFEPVEIAAGIVVAFVVVVLVYLLISQYESMQSAAAAADSACSQPGVTCTAERWAAIRDQALQASATLSILPNLGRAVEQVGSLVFWGGLLAVAGVLAYGAWVAQPAATITRDRLRAGAAARLKGIRTRGRR